MRILGILCFLWIGCLYSHGRGLDDIDDTHKPSAPPQNLQAVSEFRVVPIPEQTDAARPHSRRDHYELAVEQGLRRWLVVPLEFLSGAGTGALAFSNIILHSSDASSDRGQPLNIATFVTACGTVILLTADLLLRLRMDTLRSRAHS